MHIVDWNFIAGFGLVVVLKSVCFILGYLTIRLGYNLVASGVKGDFKFSGSIVGAKADLRSVSPGLLFVLLGVFLIGYAMYVDKSVSASGTIRRRTSTPPAQTTENVPTKLDLEGTDEGPLPNGASPAPKQ